MHFWQELQLKKQPFFVVAPMADVTDAAFRELLTKYGKPDGMWTEFVSANGLASAGRSALLYDLLYTEQERPIVAQLFTADAANMRIAAKLCAEKGFDGIDINMGCPDKTIEKQGAGARMIDQYVEAEAVIKAVKEGIADARKDIPVSVKTRVGYNKETLDEWIPFLLKQDIAALSVHARTRKDLSVVPANWSYISRVVAHRNRLGVKTGIIGNGDVVSLADGKAKARATGCDGIMVGRALFGNPWFFDEKRSIVAALPKKRAWIIRHTFLKKFFDTRRKAAQSDVEPITIKERLTVMVEHAQLFEEKLGKVKNFAVMKKHFKAYCTGFAGAKELRIKLMETKNAGEVKQIIDIFLKNQ